MTDPKLQLLELLESGWSLSETPRFSCDWLEEKAGFPAVVVSHLLTSPRHLGFTENPSQADRRFTCMYLVDVWTRGDPEQRYLMQVEVDRIMHSKCCDPGEGLESLKVSEWRDLNEGDMRPPLYRSQTRVEVTYIG